MDTAEDRYLSGPYKSVSNRGVAIYSLRQTKVNRNGIGKREISWGTRNVFRKMPIQ